MAASIGVHFGSTNVCLAIYRDGRTDVVANDSGDRVTPAIVAFLNGEKAVGIAAKQEMSRNASNTVTHVKQLIGKSEIPKFLLNSKGCKIITENGLKYEVESDGRLEFYTPVEVMELILKKMLSIAQSYIHDENVYPTVITVPFYFTKDQKIIVRNAATKAGFMVLRIVSEPAAAALAYKIGQQKDGDNSSICMIYRVGGASLDITLLEIIGGLYRVKASVHRSTLGGNNLTQALVEHCVQEFQRQYKFDIAESKRSLFKLWHAADLCKHSLSSMGSAQCFAESVYEGIDLNLSISRARFESLISNQLQQFLEPLAEALDNSDVSKQDIKKIILCGGSTKVPRLQQMLKDQFPCVELLNQINCDEVIAIGAAEQAALLVGQANVEIEDTTVQTLSKGIYLMVMDADGKEKLEPVIVPGTPVPTKTLLKFTLLDNQDCFSLNLYESSSSDQVEIDKADFLAKMVLRDLSAAAEINIAFHIRSDGSLHVTCTEKATGRSESIVVEGQNKS